MELNFAKYQGAGNDFVLLDNRGGKIALSRNQIAAICDRNFGVGADGLMLLEVEEGMDFKMVYFNSDGNESTMCGNGGRCIVAYAHSLGIFGDSTVFSAIDGTHEANIMEDGRIALHMQDVTTVEWGRGFQVLNTGSPHYIQWTDDVEAVDVIAEGKAIRYSERFRAEGINVNFVAASGEGIAIRTYERGVENETLACGTGVTAAAIVSVGDKPGTYNVKVKAMGGDMEVAFVRKEDSTVQDVILTGPAQFVFKGVINI